MEMWRQVNQSTLAFPAIYLLTIKLKRHLSVSFFIPMLSMLKRSCNEISRTCVKT